MPNCASVSLSFEPSPLEQRGVYSEDGLNNARNPSLRPQVVRALTPEAALAEYQGGSSLLPPATVATYQVTAEVMVDFSGGHDAEPWSPIWVESCPGGVASSNLDDPCRLRHLRLGRGSQRLTYHIVSQSLIVGSLVDGIACLFTVAPAQDTTITTPQYTKRLAPCL